MQHQTLTGERLRRRIDRMGWTYNEASRRLGLTTNGLQKQMRGERPVSSQTALLLECLERERRVGLDQPSNRRRK